MCLGLLCSPLCCLGCFCCCGPSWEAPVKQKFAVAKWLYLVFWTLTVVLTWVLRDYASQSFADYVGQVKDFCGAAESDEQKTCSSGQIAMRISFANFVFFMGHALLTLRMRHEGDPRVHIHASGWALKLLIWAGALVGFFFVPSSAIYGYAQFARVGSGFFLVIQLLLLIGFIYQINEWLTEKDTRAAWAVLITGAAATFSLGMVAIGFAFHWYSAEATCHLNNFFTTWSLIMGLMMIGVLFIPNRASTAGLLTSGLVFLYASFLLLSALSSEPDDAFPQCRRGTGANAGWVRVVGFFIALASVIYSTYDAGTSSSDFFGVKEDSALEEALPYRADFFHLVFALASLYIAMLFSNWRVSSSTQAFVLDRGWISTWVKMASKWSCELLYVWSVVAPALFPNRDFGR